MIKIHSYSELLKVTSVLPGEFAKYIEKEFIHLYEYLGYEEKLGEFILPTYQAMIILDYKAEINQLLTEKKDIEFEEEVIFSNFTVLRFGVFQVEDVQLCYCIVN
ncbi:hypothetical protein [Thalassobacillus sp. CUG 92003]|uniref:hypothetical protein n=1 Tax=Thalassobacillus sp. CUG 92003 TaxID=2736641 RepID=UPI0015E67877|nr:hypothetical protein [Thalassobacillus sp. CUG 92003]